MRRRGGRRDRRGEWRWKAEQQMLHTYYITSGTCAQARNLGRRAGWRREARDGRTDGHINDLGAGLGCLEEEKQQEEARAVSRMREARDGRTDEHINRFRALARRFRAPNRTRTRTGQETKYQGRTGQNRTDRWTRKWK